MDQNSMQQKIFSFKNRDRLIGLNNFLEILRSMMGISKDLIPGYEFFQIKKSVNFSNEGIKRYTI